MVNTREKRGERHREEQKRRLKKNRILRRTSVVRNEKEDPAGSESTKLGWKKTS